MGVVLEPPQFKSLYRNLGLAIKDLDFLLKHTTDEGMRAKTQRAFERATEGMRVLRRNLIGVTDAQTKT